MKNLILGCCLFLAGVVMLCVHSAKYQLLEMMPNVTVASKGLEIPLGWALLSGAFGLLFGLLCAPVYACTGGPAFAVSWWISGIPYDLLHCGGNFFLALTLFAPLRKLLGRLYGRMTAQAGAEGKTA